MKKLAIILLLLTTSCSSENKTNSNYISWLNAPNALFIEYNDGDFDYFGGFKKTYSTKKFAKKYLEESYSISSSKELIDAVSLLKDGQTQQMFNNQYSYINNYSSNKSKLKNLDKNKNEWLLKTYKEHGDTSILAFDLGRSYMLLSMGYLANYITYENALTYSLDIGKTIQDNFDTWSEYNESYLNGLYYISSTEEEKQIYLDFQDIDENINKNPSSPFDIKFNLNLNNELNDYLN